MMENGLITLKMQAIYMYCIALNNAKKRESFVFMAYENNLNFCRIYNKNQTIKILLEIVKSYIIRSYF